ncbi:hypothetical protein N7486_005717 [Penicillium sp. IBT 16267x]|nr:hypothetical protein N7486_005717 [Penicillium sp. IBT 16267x]
MTESAGVGPGLRDLPLYTKYENERARDTSDADQEQGFYTINATYGNWVASASDNSEYPFLLYTVLIMPVL